MGISTLYYPATKNFLNGITYKRGKNQSNKDLDLRTLYGTNNNRIMTSTNTIK